MSALSLVVVSAGLRQPSSTRLLADRLTEAVVTSVRGHDKAVTPTVIEVRDHAHDVMDAVLTGFASPALQSALDAVTGADAIITVTPVFTASYSGLFKSFVDVLDEGALSGIPVLLAATGGTARHSLALEHAVRPLFTYLRAVTMPTAVFAAAEDWGAGAQGGPHASLSTRITRAADELATHLAGAPRVRPADPFRDVTPFEDLLRGQG